MIFFLFLAPGVFAQCSGHAQLNRYERGQFLQVSIGQRSEVRAQFLSEAGCGGQMLDALKGLGAKIDFADKRSGYALVTVSKEKLLDTLDLPGVAYAYTRDDDRLYAQDPAAKIPQSERKAEPAPAVTIPYPRVATSVQKDGPYFAAEEIGLPELWKQHPEADGRGVEVAVADEGFDLLHPELQQAKDATGKTVAKIRDLGALTSADEDSGWVRFGEAIETKGGSFDAAGHTWIAPEEGAYRFGIFKQDLLLGPDGNSHTRKLSLSVGVLWDERSNRVWVDTDGDYSFKNQRALGDYGATHDTDWFGAKEGADDNRIPFGVKIDSTQNAVYIRIGGEHGAFVAGALAGNAWTGGLFNGAAPGAQLIDENVGRATLVASVVKMFARPDVDVVNRSGGLGRAGYTGNREGIEDFAQRVVERAIAVYNKPIATYSAAAGAIHVNDYAGPEMLRRNRQVGPPYKDTINAGFPFLPNGLVNAVVAPSANLDTDSRYKPQDITWEDGKRHIFSNNRFNPPAPDGYVIGANNSPTIPIVSGLLADLISEAKREHVRYNAMRLNNAVFTGARLLDGIPVSLQGYGLINAAQSWNQLSKMAKADDPENSELTSFTVSRADGKPEGEIFGFQADLAEPNTRLNGELLVTRHGGYAGGRKYILSLRGNDGNFALLDHTVTFERGKPVRVRFRTNGASGWRIAFLELRDAKADVVMQDVPLSVRVPDVLEKIAPGVERLESSIEPLRTEIRFVRVGDDVQAARYVMKIPFTGPENISTRSFPGGRYRTTKTPPGEPVDAQHHVGPMENLESLVVNDDPGAQEIFWENRGRPEYATEYDGPAPDAPIQAELTVSKYAVALAKSSSDALTVTNKLAEIEGKVEFYDAALKNSELLTSGPHASGELERTLPTKLTEWRLQISAKSASAGPADVYLFDCSGKEGCNLAAQKEVSGPGKTIVVDQPHEGRWRILVRSRSQVAPAPAYDVHEALLIEASPANGSSDAKHASGATWAVSLPKKQSDAQYAAFRIAGTPGDEHQKNGLRIAVTALDANAP